MKRILTGIIILAMALALAAFPALAEAADSGAEAA